MYHCIFKMHARNDYLLNSYKFIWAFIVCITWPRDGLLYFQLVFFWNFVRFVYSVYTIYYIVHATIAKCVRLFLIFSKKKKKNILNINIR